MLWGLNKCWPLTVRYKGMFPLPFKDVKCSLQEWHVRAPPPRCHTPVVLLPISSPHFLDKLEMKGKSWYIPFILKTHIKTRIYLYICQSFQFTCLYVQNRCIDFTQTLFFISSIATNHYRTQVNIFAELSNVNSPCSFLWLYHTYQSFQLSPLPPIEYFKFFSHIKCAASNTVGLENRAEKSLKPVIREKIPTIYLNKPFHLTETSTLSHVKLILIRNTELFARKQYKGRFCVSIWVSVNIWQIRYRPLFKSLNLSLFLVANDVLDQVIKKVMK